MENRSWKNGMELGENGKWKGRNLVQNRNMEKWKVLSFEYWSPSFRGSDF